MNKFFNLRISILLSFSIVLAGLLSSELTIHFCSKSQFRVTQYTIRHDPGNQWEGKTIFFPFDVILAIVLGRSMEEI